MAIPERFIEELSARCDLLDVVGDYTPLTKKGKDYWGLCPFHNEKTPSFSVSPDKRLFCCFGCGKKGVGSIYFIMEKEGLSFPDAVRFLARRQGMEVPETGEDPSFRHRRERLLELNKQAARWFHEQLRSPAGKEGAAYLFEKRKLSKATVTRFGLGMAPDGWDNLITAMASKGYDKRDLLDGGLAVKNQNGRIYDRFRNRVMFPIINIRGEVIGFGGRVLDDSTPKYLNSPDTPVYNKSRNLFALNIAKKSKLGYLILTEGYMDTISLHQAGFDCAVASLGTSLTAEHAQLISRYADQAVIAYDGDGAGVAAAQRAIPILEKTGMKVKVLRITGAKDPDEYIKTYGAEGFKKLIERSDNHIEYRLNQIRAKYNVEDDSQKVEFLRECAGLVASLRSPLERDVYGARAAEAVGVSPEAMAQEVREELRRREKAARKRQERKDLTPATQLQPAARELRYENMRSARAEEGVIRLLLLDEGLFPQTEGLQREYFTSPFLGQVFDLLRQRHREGRPVELELLAGQLTPEQVDQLAEILKEPENLANGAAAMGDYLSIIDTERAKRRDDIDPLLAARAKYLEKKSYGGTPNE